MGVGVFAGALVVTAVATNVLTTVGVGGVVTVGVAGGDVGDVSTAVESKVGPGVDAVKTTYGVSAMLDCGTIPVVPVRTVLATSFRAASSTERSRK